MLLQRQQQWQLILRLTEQMRGLAMPNESLTDLSVDDDYAKQPWQSIADIESQRFQLLQQFFATEPAADEVSVIAEGIKSIQATDLELSRISQKIKNETASVFSRISNAQHVASAYSSNK
ncbi:MAG: hypothetical protein OEY29_13850 [Gammaproteobacteria bacterium]|nr:hypothetical protein [Gammaproteobacteria bacterium]